MYQMLGLSSTGLKAKININIKKSSLRMVSLFKILSQVATVTAVQGAVLTFDDIPNANFPTCGNAALPKPYKGFTVTGTLLNTTATSQCHPSSAGWGPWGSATSPPNILACTGKSCVISRPSCFGLSKVSIGSTDLNRLEDGSSLEVRLTGKRANGSVKKVIKKKFVKGVMTGGWPQTVTLNGLTGVRKVEIFVERTQIIGGDAVVVSDGTAYLDSIKYEQASCY
ncbi:hypothetical protein EDC01DRAFT_673728 [Geopyxis carbonaria]|nr:hypothetical protein EDC01DRAFT_673728 [Geopyxis carbonaria]